MPLRSCVVLFSILDISVVESTSNVEPPRRVITHNAWSKKRPGVSLSLYVIVLTRIVLHRERDAMLTWGGQTVLVVRRMDITVPLYHVQVGT